jgi:hypothetical protein
VQTKNKEIIMKYLLLLLTIIPLVSCDNKTTIKQKDTSVIQNLSEADSIPTIDTTIILTDIVKSNYYGQHLTDSIAKKILYTYFKSKGYYNSDNLPDIQKLTDADNDKLCVRFNEIFLTELNGNKNEDAIISYWLAPPYASGHCWQPHKAIISDTEKGYKITNEEFILDNFAIDSVQNKNGQVTIYGYDYDCGNHMVLRNIRVRIK